MKPVIIIGAPRSGTNMLRDVISGIDGIGTWPCDEINYIWRFGNRGHSTDEFTADMVDEKSKDFIANQFELLASKTGSNMVLEKTCANSLRVEYVDAIFPQCKYIYIVRDGIDVVGSSVKRWKASLDLRYIYQKAKYVPFRDIPYYAASYLKNRISKIVSPTDSLAVWGPRFKGMEDLSNLNSVEEICAYQWQRCVVRSEEAFAHIGPERVHKVKYEDFVANPIEELGEITRFLGCSLSESQLSSLVPNVSVASIGKGRRQLGTKKVHRVEEIISSTLSAQGYALGV